MKRFFYILFVIPTTLMSQEADQTISKEITRIAFGSCSKQDQADKQLWNEINDTSPDLWIWLGDNIYGDTRDMNVMKEKYDLQKSHPGYQKLLQQTTVIGIWDDHDFGVNDGGKEYASKDGSKQQLFDFLDIDENHPAQKRTGAYQSYTYKSKGGNIKVILLDTRYFRDSLKWENPGTRQKASIENPTGDILGEVQWKWFENQLREPGIDFFIVASGIQAIPMQHRWEKWANFPKSRARLLETIASNKAPLVLLTGDRHLSEVSKIELPGYQYPLYEFTSSSLTSGTSPDDEKNKFMIKEKIYETNFALLSLKWTSGTPELNLKYHGKNGDKLAEHTIQYK